MYVIFYACYEFSFGEKAATTKIDSIKTTMTYEMTNDK
jgi:hypothetical protein